MPDLRELYQQTILDHHKKPRNRRKLECAETEQCNCADGRNPLCGDHLTIYLKLESERIVDAAFEGDGCAISTASASMMTEALKGKTIQEAEDAFEHFHHMLTCDKDEAHKEAEALGKLAVFEGVREFPVRIKCASLAWHAMRAALHHEHEVSTE